MEETTVEFVLGRPLRGWLRRQGGMMRGWQRKFFVLKDSCLFCFHREDDTQVASTYLLDCFQLRDVPASPEEPDKFAFELVPERGAECVSLSAASDQEKKEWMKALCYHIYVDKGGAMFGLPLSETMKYEHRHGRSIPHLVQACIEHLEKYALDSEGIFRLAGRAGLLRELRGQFEMGQRPALDNIDVHTVGSLLKAYLRELPESLIPPDFYQRVMNCAMRHTEASTDQEREAEVDCLSQLLAELPDDNYVTLSYICGFLHRLAANSDKTKMTAHNLSLVFGPNLIRHMDNSPELLMLTADLNQQLAFMLISHCPQVLPPRAPQQSAPMPAADSPMMRHKQLIATDDLLRLSQPVDIQDPSLLAPRPSALRDLMGLQLTVPTTEAGDNNNSSPQSPPSPFVFVNDYFDDKEESTTNTEHRPVPPKRTKSRINRNRRSAGAPPSPMSPDSPRHLDSQDILTALASTGPPEEEGQVESKGQTEGEGKAKSRDQTEDKNVGEVNVSGLDLESRPQDANTVLFGNKPNHSDIPALGTSDGMDRLHSVHSSIKKTSEESVSRDHEVSHSTDSPVLRTKLSSASYSSTVISSSHRSAVYQNWKSTTENSLSLPPSSTEGEKLQNSDTPGAKEVNLTRSKTIDSSRSRNTDRVRPSPAVLEAQVAGLKAELVSLKTRSDRMVSALKNQLTEIRCKYESRISSLEKQHHNQVMDLTAKLNAERKARAEAVDKTVNLQSQLYKYKLHYGSPQD